MAKYAYRPKDNRTPVFHPIFGGLEYGTVVDSDTNPGSDFEPVKPEKKQPAAHHSTAHAKPADSSRRAPRSRA